MKKILTHLFVFTIVILLTACGKDLEPEKSASNRTNDSIAGNNSLGEDVSDIDSSVDDSSVNSADSSNDQDNNSKPEETTQNPVQTTKPAQTQAPKQTTKATTTTKKPVQTTKPAVTTSKPTYDSSFTSEVLRLVNVERQNAGLSPLGTSTALNQAAQVRANELIQLFDHKRPDGRSIWTVLDEHNISRTTSGENIAAGQTTPAKVVEEWMNSPGHRANILNASFKQLGVGYAKTNSGYKHHWAQLFIG